MNSSSDHPTHRLEPRMMTAIHLTDAELAQLRGLGQGQVPAVVERILAERLAGPLDAVAYLRETARRTIGTPGDAARRSALGQAANALDRGVSGTYDRELDQAYRRGVAAGRAEDVLPCGFDMGEGDTCLLPIYHDGQHS